MRALEGVRVLDLSRLIPGPFATLVLSDLGARVDKIEDRAVGDYLRFGEPQRAGAAAAFHALNRGKRSAVVDLKDPGGRAAFERLIVHYDVLLEQFRPGVLDRLGLSHRALLARHPRLVICALTGYGQSGPLRDRAGHDLNYLARSGLLAAHGPAEGPPQVPGFQLADVSGGMWCVIAVLAALRRRDATGAGEVCDVAMTEGVLGFSALQIAAALAGAPIARGGEILTGGIAPYNTYTSKDGATVTLGSLEPKFWFTFAKLTGVDPDPTALLPGPHQPALKALLTEVFARRTRQEWIDFGAANDCCVEAVLTAEEIRSDAHLGARGMFFEQTVDGESIVAFRTPVSPTELTRARAPRRGEHTREIFREGGFDDSEIDALVAAGAVEEG